MSRNGSGTYTKAVSSFSPGGTITAADHNSLWDDIVTEITNSIAADGQTSITGPIKFASGSKAAPSLTFGSDTDTGVYLSSANEVSIVASASQVAIFSATAATINVPTLFISTVTISATATFTTGFVASQTCAFSHPVLMSGTATFTNGFLASNTCSFSHPILVSGTATFTKGFIASASCVFVEPILCSGTATFTKGFIASATAVFTVPPKGKNLPAAYALVTVSGGTPTLQSGSHNVASVASQGTGHHRVTFTNAMSSTTYTPIVCLFEATSGTFRVAGIRSLATTYVDVAFANLSGSGAEPAGFAVAVFGDLA